MTRGIAGLVEEQHSVGSGLLDHLCVNVVAVRPGVGVFVVGVGDQAGEVRLLVARGGIVESEEGGRHGGDRDEETSLHPQLAPVFSRSLCAPCASRSRVSRTPKLSLPEEVWWASPAPWLALRRWIWVRTPRAERRAAL